MRRGGFVGHGGTYGLEQMPDGGSKTTRRSTYYESENGFPEEAGELKEVTESIRGLANRLSQGPRRSDLWRRVRGPQAGGLKVRDLDASWPH